MCALGQAPYHLSAWCPPPGVTVKSEFIQVRRSADNLQQERLYKDSKHLSWENHLFFPSFAPTMDIPWALPWGVRAHQTPVRQLVGTLSPLSSSVALSNLLSLSERRFLIQPHGGREPGWRKGRIKVRLRDDPAWYLAHPWCLAMMTVGPSLACLLTGRADLPCPRTGAGPTQPPCHLSAQFSPGSHGFAFGVSSPSCLSPLPAPGVVQALGSRMGEIG